MRACVLSCFSRVWFCATLEAVAHQAPLSMGFSRQEYWSGLPCPPPGDLPDPGIESSSLLSLALADGFFTTAPPWEPTSLYCNSNHFLIPEPISLSGGHLNSTKLRNFPPIFLLKCFKRMKTWSYLCLEKIKKKSTLKKRPFDDVKCWWGYGITVVLLRCWGDAWNLA